MKYDMKYDMKSDQDFVFMTTGHRHWLTFADHVAQHHVVHAIQNGLVLIGKDQKVVADLGPALPDPDIATRTPWVDDFYVLMGQTNFHPLNYVYRWHFDIGGVLWVLFAVSGPPK